MKKYERYIYICSCIVLFLFSSFVIIKSVKTHYRFIAHPYQLEYREGAALNITNLYLNNRNPFSIDEQPQNTYVFGFLYPLAVTPIANVFGNTLFVHRSFVYLFVWATCLLVFYVLLKMKINFAFAFAAMIILHQSIINAANTAVARPEGLGIFLFTLGLIIPWRWNYSGASLAASIVIGTLGYLTKPYYVFVIPVIAAYLFIFVSKKRSLIYIFVSSLFLFISISITSLVYPLYLNNTVVYHVTDSVFSIEHMINQVVEYAEINLFLFLIIFLSCIIIFMKYLYRNKPKSFKQILVNGIKNIKSKINFKITGKEPLFKSRFDFLFGFAFLVSLILFIVKLGGHTGNWMGAYLFHLASPFLILVTFRHLEKTSSKIFQSFASILLIFTMFSEFKSPEYNFDKYVTCFKQIDELIMNSDKVLNSPDNVSIMIRENKTVYNSGLSECFSGIFRKKGIMAAATKGVAERMNEFQSDMDEKINRKEFDLILLSKDYYSFFVNENLLHLNYDFTGTVYTPFYFWDKLETEIWLPKRNQ